MSTLSHPAAPQHLPFYLPGSDGSDPVMVGTGILLVVAVLAFGLLFLRIHMLPDHIAHRGQKMQLEVAGVLGLISMVTGIHAFWVAALLLALLDIPDFAGPMRRIAGSAERVAGLPPGTGDMSNDRPPAHDTMDERTRAPEAAHGPSSAASSTASAPQDTPPTSAVVPARGMER